VWEAIVQRGVVEGDARDDKEGSEELHGAEEWIENTNGSHWKRGGEAHGNQQHRVKQGKSRKGRKETVSFGVSNRANSA